MAHVPHFRRASGFKKVHALHAHGASALCAGGRERAAGKAAAGWRRGRGGEELMKVANGLSSSESSVS